MDGWINIGTKVDKKSFDAQIDYIEQRMEEIEYKLEQADLGFDVGDTTKLEAEYEKLGNQLTKLIDKQKELNQETSEMPESVSNVGESMAGTVKSVGKWALAIFGVRSAYMGIRSVISTVSQYNEELAAQLESIKYTLAMALEPVVEAIVNAVYRLIQYVNYLAEAWFGVNLFANANAKAMNNANKSAKELKKSMAGFDTANVLSDTSSSSSTADVSAMTELPQSEVPEWLIWIKDNGEILAGIIAGITAAIIALKFGAEGLVGLGIGLLLAGIVTTVLSLISFLKNPTWEKFGKVLQGIALILAGIALLIGSVPVAIAAAVALIVGLVISNWEKVKQVFGEVGKWFTEKFQEAYDGITNVFKNIGNFFAGIWGKIKSVFSTIGTAIGNAFKSAFVAVINSVLESVESVINAPIKAINKLLDKINTLPGVNLKTLSTISLPKLASGGIVNNPGRGVPVGNAIAGEAGREGVLPLTDSQAMAQLGAEIGKWISVNVDLTTKLDSRVLSRSLEKVQSNSNFVRNGV